MDPIVLALFAVVLVCIAAVAVCLTIVMRSEKSNNAMLLAFIILAGVIGTAAGIVAIIRI